jgi:hypothetical protein
MVVVMAIVVMVIVAAAIRSTGAGHLSSLLNQRVGRRGTQLG